MTEDLLDRRWSPSAKAAASRVGEETVLLHLESGTYFGLDPLGSRVWRCLKDGDDLRYLIVAVASDHDVPVDRVEADVRLFMVDLVKHDLVDPG